MPLLPSIQLNPDDVDESVSFAAAAAIATANGGMIIEMSANTKSNPATAAVDSTAITVVVTTELNNPPLVVDGYLREGIDGMSDQLRRHAKAFYETLIPIYLERSHTFKLFTRKSISVL
jgi:hypothetical protein